MQAAGVEIATELPAGRFGEVVDSFVGSDRELIHERIAAALVDGGNVALIAIVPIKGGAVLIYEAPCEISWGGGYHS